MLLRYRPLRWPAVLPGRGFLPPRSKTTPPWEGNFFCIVILSLSKDLLGWSIPLLLWRGAQRAWWSMPLKLFRTLTPPFRMGIARLRAGIAWLRMGIARFRAAVAPLRMGIARLRAVVAPLRMGIARLRATVAPLRMGIAWLRAGIARVRVQIACLMRQTSCTGRVCAASVGTVLCYILPFVNCRPIRCLYCGLCNP